MTRNDVTQSPRSICSGCNALIYRHSRGGKRESSSFLKMLVNALHRLTLTKLDSRLRGNDGEQIHPAQSLDRANGSSGKGAWS
jgi:hypothetical protein